MTSVSVISAAIARIQHFPTPKDTPNWENDAGKLQADLKRAKKWLEDADQEKKQSQKFVDWEKKIVALCYEIDDTLAEIDMSLITAKPGRVTNFLARHISERNSKPDLGNLVSRLSEIAKGPDEKTLGTKEGEESTIKIPPQKKMARFGGFLPRIPSIKLPLRSTNSTPPVPELENTRENPRTGEDLPDMDGDPVKETLLKKEKLLSNSSTTGEDQADMVGKESEALLKKEKLSSNPGATPAGLEDQVIESLLRKKKLPVVCIWGNRGMGKTTFAKKIFYKKQVRLHFEAFAWVSIEQDFQTKKVLQDTLLQLLGATKGNIRSMSEFELSQEIVTVHNKKKCLVVLEDVRTAEDWQSIRVAFRTTDESDSKILINTPFLEVGQAAASEGGLYEMSPLTQEECFNMLKKKAKFGEEELENVGKIIFSVSGGSRLPAMILGKSLKTMAEDARKKLLDSNKIQGDGEILRLSYEVLSHELKPCLLHMGQFPEGREVEVEKLYLLLSAEELIIQQEGSASAPRKTIYMDILNKLALKSLVQVQEVSATRMHQSCKLHDQIRDFCISQGSKEEYFEIVDFKTFGGKLKPSPRRLAIYLDKYKDENNSQFSNDQDMEKKIIRSLLIFDTYESEQKSTWPSELNDLKDFIRLKVLDFDGINFGVRNLPKGIDKLVFLKYLSFRGCFLEVIPSYISKLQFLETLDLRTNGKMTIPDVLHTMKRLRHLYFPKEYESEVGKNKLRLNGLEKLEILVNFDTSVCEVKDLSELKNLLILTTITNDNYEDLEVVIKCLDENWANLQHSSVSIRNFDSYTKERETTFKHLLECKYIHSLNMEGQIGQIKKDINIFSSSITELVFDGSELKDDDPMAELGKLETLRSLVLSNDAFIGKEMKFSATGFSNLRILKLLNLSYLKRLTFEKGAMPKLSTLVIENCRVLGEVLMPEALNNSLLRAQGNNQGDDVYSVEKLPTIIKDS